MGFVTSARKMILMRHHTNASCGPPPHHIYGFVLITKEKRMRPLVRVNRVGKGGPWDYHKET